MDILVILRASADGNVALLKKLIAEKWDPNASNDIGQTGLHLAAMWGHPEVAELLLKAGANVNVANDWGVTPLHYAVENRGNNYDVVKVLLKHGADPSATNKVRPRVRLRWPTTHTRTIPHASPASTTAGRADATPNSQISRAEASSIGGRGKSKLNRRQ